MRTLHFYLECLKDVSLHLRSLLISPSKPLRPISKNTLSIFLCKCISRSGVVLGPARASSAHSIRGVPTSVNFMKNWSLQSVLEVTCWRLNSIFMSFYVKDVQFMFDSCRSLDPIVAAEDLIG